MNIKRYTGILATLIILWVSISAAGCIQTAGPAYTATEILPEMETAMADLSIDLQNLDVVLSTDLYYLADRVGDAETTEEVNHLLKGYYAENAWLEGVIYYNNLTGTYTDIPLHSKTVYENTPHPSEEELVSAGGTLNLGPVFIPGRGYLEVMYMPVFTPSGVYQGYVMNVYNLGNILEEYHDITGLNHTHTYNGYAALILDDENRVCYAMSQDCLGTTVTAEKPLYTSIGAVFLMDGDKGAYVYGEKKTGWQKYSAHKSSYTMYVTKPEKETTGLQDKDPDALKKTIENVWLEAVITGEEKVQTKINTGEFEYDLFAIDYNGTILAAPEEHANAVGRNFMLIHDSYQVTYIQNMIATAQQGGGYVKIIRGTSASQSPDEGYFVIGYVLPVNSKWMIAGFVRGTPDTIEIDYGKKSGVVSVSRACMIYAEKFGDRALVELINTAGTSKGSSLNDGGVYQADTVILMDYKGTVLAHSTYPEITGTSGTYYIDIFGGSVVRKAVILAKNGGGMMYDYQWDKDNPGYCQLQLWSVEPVDETCFVISTIKVATIKNYVTENIYPKSGFDAGRH